MPNNHQEIITFYNVENLFLPDASKSSRSKSGLWNWDEKKYNNKLFKIAHVFDLIKSETGIMPMLIGLSEIENNQVLENLLEKKPFTENFGIVHYNSMDERGIDVAVLYDKTKLELMASEPISFEFLIRENPTVYDTTRDVLWCKFKYDEAVFNFFVLHLPSKREKDINQPKRKFILDNIKERVVDMVSNNEFVIVAGDFNENPNEDNIEDFMYKDGIHHLLHNPFELLFAQKEFTAYYHQEGLGFDQIMLSNHFFKSNAQLKYIDAEVFHPHDISSWGKRSQQPFRTYSGTRYLGGYSDHYPVFVRISTQKK